jgi:hypothetical protein
MFRRNALLPSSWSKYKSKLPAKLFAAFDPEEGCTTFLRSFGKFLSDYTAFIVTAMRINISYSCYYATTVRWAVIPYQFLGKGSLNTSPRQRKTVRIRELCPAEGL